MRIFFYLGLKLGLRIASFFYSNFTPIDVHNILHANNSGCWLILSPTLGAHTRYLRRILTGHPFAHVEPFLIMSENGLAAKLPDF